MSKKKILLLFLSVLLFSSLLFLKISAESSYAMVSWNRFAGQYFSSNNATLSADENGCLNIDFKRTAPIISVNVNADGSQFSRNAIRLSLTNRSACNSLYFKYQYLDKKGSLHTVSEKIALGARNIRGDYYVYTDVADQIVSMTMIFSGVSSGTITIKSIDFVSVYDDREDACGVVTSCVYDKEDDTIKIKGNINYDIVTAHRKARLVLYAVDMDMNSLPYGSLPLVSIPMSSHFDFSISKISIEDRLRAYVVAVVSEGGELLYTFSPRVPTSEKEDEEEGAFYKGIHSDYGLLAARANANLAVVDVDFSKLSSSNVGEGFLYAFGGNYYYFNRQYLSVLDAEIQKNYKNGMDVALRFMSSEVSSLGFSKILADSDKALLQLYAYTQFLCTRYSDSSRGVISSIIFGSSADAVFTEKNSALQYTRFYADSLFAISEASAVGRNVRIVVPISDFLEKGKAGNVLFSPRVFLTSLGKILQKRYVGGVNFQVMLESSSLSGEGDVNSALGLKHLQDFVIFLRQMHDAYPVISDRYLYYWAPRDTVNKSLMKASLLHAFYALVCERDACGFIFSTSYITDVSLTADLMSFLQYADTTIGQGYSDLALSTLGKSDWQTLIAGYSQDKVCKVQYREITDVTTPPFRFLGECYLWDFSKIGTDYGWSPGDGCDAIVVEKNEETNRALAATMRPLAENNYESELLYYFDEDRAFTAVDAISFALCVDAPKGQYKITIQICGENEISEAQLSVPSGKLTTVYLNTAGMFTQESVRCIRIFATSISGSSEEYTLLIGSVSAHSTTQRSDDLEQILRQTQGDDVYEEATHKIEPIWIYAILFLLIISAMVVLTLHFRNEEST